MQTLNFIKYSNRKIYSKDLKRYVTLSELNDVIREGNSITVIDNETSNDITDTILKTIVSFTITNINTNELYNLIRG
jgi:polyhydroxyalkanoate synthesis regulator protein